MFIFLMILPSNMQREQAYQSDEDQVYPDDVFKQARDHQDQDSGDQGQQRG
jgi:hypothetical protein